MESDWKRMRHADLVDPYRARVGAGTTAAREEMRAMAGAREVCWRSGICRAWVGFAGGVSGGITHECDGRHERAEVVAVEGGVGDVSGPLQPCLVCAGACAVWVSARGVGHLCDVHDGQERRYAGYDG